MAQDVLTLKDMTRGSGCTPRTVRYYERQGLLRALRSAGGHRLFSPAELERLNFIISLREAGWSLDEVTEFLEIRDGSSGDALAVDALGEVLQKQRHRLLKKIELLQRLHEDLIQTSEVLRVCGECATEQVRVDCRSCERLVPLQSLPRAFRLIWRSRELDGAAPFDERAADLVEVDEPSP